MKILSWAGREKETHLGRDFNSCLLERNLLKIKFPHEFNM